MRDLPYGHDVLMENIADPAHLPWSHHKLSPILKREAGDNPMPFVPLPLPDDEAQPANGKANGKAAGSATASDSSSAETDNSSESERQEDSAESFQEGAKPASQQPQPPSYLQPGARPLASYSFTSVQSREPNGSEICVHAPGLVTYRYALRPGASPLECRLGPYRGVI